MRPKTQMLSFFTPRCAPSRVLHRRDVGATSLVDAKPFVRDQSDSSSSAYEMTGDARYTPASATAP